MTRSGLTIARGVELPPDAVTEVIGFLGRRGQGKSYAAQRLAELFYEIGAQFVALDPVGNWWGLRLAADGKSPGIPIPVFGGLYGDVPLEPTAGKLIADLVVDRGISVVLDVSQFESDRARNKFVHDFGARFYFRQKQTPAAVHLFLEESQEFVPQQPSSRDGENNTLNVLQRITKLGRNYGIGVSLISQRPQEVHKKVLNLAELLFVFQLSVEVSVLEDRHLTTLKTTVDRMGDVAEQLVTVGGEIRGAVGAIVEALHKIRNGKPPAPRAVARRSSTVTTTPLPSRVSRGTPAIDPSVTNALADLTGPHQRILDALAWLESIGVNEPENAAVAFMARYSPRGGAYANPRGQLATMELVTYPNPGLVQLTERGRSQARYPETPGTTQELHDHVLARLDGPMRKILRPLLEAYPETLANADLADRAGYSETGGAYANPRGRLRTLGLIEYPQPGYVRARDILFPV